MSELWYEKWAENWNEALPAGNGRIGAMVFSNPIRDELYLNEETLWSGSPEKESRSHSISELEEIRKHIAKKEFDKSDAVILNMMDGRRSQMYLSLGKLVINENNIDPKKITGYRRTLCLDTAVITTEYSCYDENLSRTVTYKRECFTSLSDDVLALRVSADNKHISAAITFDLNINCTEVSYAADSVYIEGRCPTNYFQDSQINQLETDKSKESIPFCIQTKVLTDGSIRGSGNRLVIENASYYTLIYSIATGFNGFDKQPISQGKPYKDICCKKLADALGYSFDELMRRHTEAYRKQYSRVRLHIDGAVYSDVPTDKRIQNAANGTVDNGLTVMLFDYARYLLISCSQEGGQPANLQGIWTKDIISPWNSSYTVNINTEMNYWAAEQINLPECHMPLLTMIKELAARGNYFGLKGWCCSHNTDIWRFNSEASKFVMCGFWHMAGIWLSRHIYEHYRHTRDIGFLKEYFYVLEGIYDFLADWLIKDEDGKLTTCPSTSPENTFMYNGIRAAAAKGSAMDLSIIADYLNNTIELSGVLGKDSTKYKEMLSNLAAVKIGKDGRILEFSEEFEESEPGHRHISHLYGVYPGNTIKEGTPEFEAAKKSLEFRLANGGGHTGWSNAWIANVYARFKDGESANRHIINMLKKSIYPNMLDAHPPFQIDGNFGICSAICEMLVQSHNGKTEFLPAVPKAWASGYVKGLKTANGEAVSFSWKNGTLTACEIR